MIFLLSLDALQLEHRRVRQILLARGPLDRLPGEVVAIDFRDDVCGRDLLPIAERRNASDRPLLAVARPGPFAEGAAGVEGPGANALARRVPADPLDSAADRDVFPRGGVGGEEKVLVVGPGVGHLAGLGVLGVLRPVADKPFQPFEVFVVGGGRRDCFAHRVHEPPPILLDVDQRVACGGRRPSVGGEDLRDPVLDGEVWLHESSREDGDVQLRPLLGGEQRLVGLGDGLASLALAADGIDVIALLRPELGQGLGVALVEGSHELLGPLLQGLLFRRVVFWVLGPRRGREEQDQAERCPGEELRAHGLPPLSIQAAWSWTVSSAGLVPWRICLALATSSAEPWAMTRYLPALTYSSYLRMCCLEMPSEANQPKTPATAAPATAPSIPPSMAEPSEPATISGPTPGTQKKAAPTSRPKMPPTHAPVRADALATSQDVTKPWTFFSVPRFWAMIDTCWMGKPPTPSLRTASSAWSMWAYTATTELSVLIDATSKKRVDDGLNHLA